jgi:hypothetical protein
MRDARALVLALLSATAAAACASPGAAAPDAPPTPTGGPSLTGPPAFAVGGFRIELPVTTLAPGEEIEPCFVLPLVVEGPSRLVGGAVLRTPPGMHHGNITARPAGGADPCVTGDPAVDIVDGGTVLFASSTQVSGEEWYRFADGMGFRVREGHVIVARMHYLNAGEAPITVAPTYEWFTIDTAHLVEELAPFLWTYSGFMIPAMTELTVAAECLFGDPQHPMHVVSLLPHMHKLGTALSADIVGGPRAGDRFLDSPGYDPEDGVLRLYDPGVDLSAADGFGFSCTWNNTLDRTIREGIGDNEMCMIFGYAWPADQAFNALANDAGCLTLRTPLE